MADFSARTDKFIAFLQENDVTISPKLQIADLRAANQGRGIIALEDIEIDETLFTIPRTVLINSLNNSLVQDQPELADKLAGLENEWDALILVLLYEYKRKESKWTDYFNVLPDLDTFEFHELLFWNDEQLSDLKPSLVLDRIGKDKTVEMYERLVAIVNQWNLEELKGMTMEEFTKIATIIMSYSFDVAQGTEDEDEDEDDEEEEEEVEYIKSMVPLADTLNADTHLNNAILTYNKNQDLVMTCIKPIKKGEQVYNTYSDHPNCEILRRYGYVETTGSKYDFGEIPLTLITSHFSKSLSEQLVFDLLEIITEISQEEQEDDEPEVVAESYDCYSSKEVNLTFVFLIQLVTIIALIHKQEPITADIQNITRIYKKCYQLVESKKVTTEFVKNYTEILQARINEYPPIAKEPYDKELKEPLRKSMAEVVLKSEYQSLSNCLDVDATLANTLDGSVKTIDDDKLIRNILKKRSNEDISSNAKRTKN
ncbi:uncharacterized protein SPAPADRAFT_138237 [Spathaspora passalidarum NRRL Y-27907]|uniref:Ribosomal lysine N-methyltransferase 4 n=1 Tax=Spathaspora passalidarum (strain NRRL Y-27907 / 11-Y1) TaxID=619300 RepID=G3AP24_SPAPN|nr:uncharacterized protein SPAPADRAFT_138237 [Spathaspora passalidarum NRRL Y-27907]EGW32056.1 hypothetical protein SPAPADRAFT_138237 [Spathaspora passalidarum NRRL Y-27907]